MFRILVRICLMVNIALPLLAPPALAASARADKKHELSTRGPGKQLSTIVLAGVAGGILGLSTLSFYGRPQDRLKYIPIGAAIGIIIGATYTTFKAATEPQDFYSLKAERDEERWALIQNPREKAPPNLNPVPKISMSFTF